MRARGVRVLGAGILVWACASPPLPPVTVRVMNHSRVEIEGIRMKDCEADESTLTPVAGTELAVGSSTVIEVPSSCIDLVAFDRSGKIAAQQRDLHALPGTIWTIH